MEGQDIRGLLEAYSQVYETPEVLNEEVEQIEEQGSRSSGGPGSLGYKPKPMGTETGRQLNAVFGQGNRLLGSAPRQTSVNQRQNLRGGGSRPVSSTPAAKPAAPAAAAKPTAPAKPAAGAPPKPAPTAAAKPTPAGGSVPKPGGAKPPSTSTTPTKPAGSAMDQWAKANPKLAAAKAERDRTRGTSATTNPLMKDMKDRLPAPKEPAPSTAKTGFDLAKKGVNLAADVDIFDLVKGHLLDEGYAETEENALVMMANMSEEWRESIIMELTGGKGHPGYKAGSKDHGPMQSGHPADSEKRKDKGGTMSQRHGYHLGDMDDEDDDEDDLESVVKQQSRDSRERVRKPLRDKVKAARKQITRESIEQIAEISKELATKAFATRARDAFEMDDNKQHDKADKTKERIVKKHGKEAGDEAEKAAERAIYGHNKYSEAQEREREKKKSTKKEGIELEDILALNRKMERVYEAQRARENPEDHDKEEKRKYEPVRGEKTPMPPRGDKRREDFEKWYAKHVR